MATATIYGKYVMNALSGLVDIGSGSPDTLTLTLHTSSYTPSQLHEHYDDLTNEITPADDYSAGGKALTNLSLSFDNVDTITFDADDVTWTTSTLTARYAVLSQDTATPATDVLIMYLDFGSDQSSSAADFTVQWNTGGIFTVTLS